MRSYETWTQTYPRDWRPWTYLANLYLRMARYQDAIAAGKEALRLNPQNGLPYVVLTRAYKRATRFADARAVAAQAVARKLDGWDIHGLLYEIAFAQGDTATMAEQVAREKNKPTEIWMLDYEADAAATAGKLDQARVLFQKAIDAAQAQGTDTRETVTDFLCDYTETMANLGMRPEARVLAVQAANGQPTEDCPYRIAKGGDFEDAARLANSLGKLHPDSTAINEYFRPLTQAVIDLGKGNADNAIAVLRPAMPYEMQEFKMASVLGAAYLDLKEPEKAANEYRKILTNRGVDANSTLYPLAYLGLARALHMQGKFGESRGAYLRLLDFWKDADKDLPPLLAAQREYAQLAAL